MGTHRTTSWATVFVATGAMILLGGPFSALAAAGPLSPPSTSNGTVLWAYGAQGGSNVSGVHNGTMESRSVYFGWHVILTQTNLSAATFELEIVRTMGFTVYATFCNPNCAHPILYANLSVKAWERSVGFANFTTTGSVELNGSAVPALAIVDDHASVNGNVTESLTGTVHRLIGSSSTASGYTAVHDAATVSVAFSPALGLIPTNLSPHQTWSSTSHYVATGSWLGGYLVARTGFNGTPVGGQRLFSGSANGSGNLSVQGAYAGSEQLNDGALTSAVHLSITGPFDLREGILLVPLGADLFGGAGHDWSGAESSAETADTSALDLALHGVGHFGLLATATGYAGAVANPNQPGSTPSVTPSAAPSGVQLQGQPESVQSAQQNSDCLVTSTCPGSGPPSALGRGTLGGLVVASLLTAAVVGLVLTIAARRRPVRPPKRRSAPGYPAGAAGPTPAAQATSAEAAPAVAETPDAADPLDHLW
ncbi:MAG: hypothetical protein L3K23_03935 [Thermoplasmata archaeon]|nr:hypothetical protein [Thermoplasmata archaeon]